MIERLQAGEKTPLAHGRQGYTVHARCGGQAGYVLCVCHPRAQFAALGRTPEMHAETPGAHLFAWMCPKHGLEEWNQ